MTTEVVTYTVDEINQQYDTAVEATLQAAEQFVKLGKMCQIAKAECKGSWMTYCDHNFKFGYRQAERYIQLHEHKVAYLEANKTEQIGIQAFLKSLPSSKAEAEKRAKPKQQTKTEEPKKPGPKSKEEFDAAFNEHVKAKASEPPPAAEPEGLQHWRIKDVLIMFGIDVDADRVKNEAIDWLILGFRRAYHPDKGFDAEMTQKVVLLAERFKNVNASPEHGLNVHFKQKRGF